MVFVPYPTGKKKSALHCAEQTHQNKTKNQLLFSIPPQGRKIFQKRVSNLETENCPKNYFLNCFFRELLPETTSIAITSY